MKNPFPLYGYSGPNYFCDRERELSTLIEGFRNHRHIVLHSMRRLGKTSLIHHFQRHLKRKNDVLTIYCDVHSTDSDAAFLNKLITATISSIEDTESGVVERISSFFSHLRPRLTFDPVTQLPAIDFTIEDTSQVPRSLEVLMTMLNNLKRPVQIAIDEFQQISAYQDDTQVDAALRSSLHLAPDIHFLFSGSQRHLLLDLFSATGRPFFSSVDQLELSAIDRQIYADFLHMHFHAAKQSISMTLIDEILDWTRGHTFYTQYFCNRLYSIGIKQLKKSKLEVIKQEILFSFDTTYLALKASLSSNQWKLLQAIAKEGTVERIHDMNFLANYKLAASTASQSLEVLLRRELLYEKVTRQGREIFVYDVFLMQWIRSLD